MKISLKLILAIALLAGYTAGSQVSAIQEYADNHDRLGKPPIFADAQAAEAIKKIRGKDGE